MKKMPVPRLAMAISLLMGVDLAYAVAPPGADTYTKQIWMDETLTNVTGNDVALNSVKADQSGATSGLIDVYQNGEGNQAWSTVSMPGPDGQGVVAGEQALTQTGSGNTLRIGQGATYDANAATWAGRWTTETAVTGNIVGASQSGSDNLAEIYQLGDANTVDLIQSGSSGVTNITQSSSNNSATVNQSNAGNSATINQAGSGGKSASITQSGMNSGVGHTASITQNDTSLQSSTATISQTSSAASTAAVTQTGNTASSTTINQSGTAGHQATVYQNGGQLTVNQTGSAAQSLTLGNATTAARFSNQGLTVTQSAGGLGNSVDMSSYSVQDQDKGVYGTITQVGSDSASLLAKVEVDGLALDSGVYIKQSGTGNQATARFTDSGGVVDIQQANGAGGTGGNNVRAAVSGGAQMVINQEGSGNAIDAEMSGGSLSVGSTAHSSGGAGAAGQSGSNNRMVIRGTGGVVTASQGGSGNKIHLGTGLMGSGVTYDANGDIASVTATAGGGVTGGNVNVAQTGVGNLINVATTTSSADLNVVQSGGARADLNTVSSAVNILQ